MSYILFLRGFECELAELNIAQTKQVNDIANITNRNSNFTQSIKLPKTAKNILIMQNLGAVGNQTNIPYEKITASLIDTDTGQQLITDGWAVVTETNQTFNIVIYDGYIDFFRTIENITITDCGISDLNHIKSLANIIDTWVDLTKPYRYILADYNGNNFFNNRLNIDYQVPSASVPYIWNRIFDFIGYEYEGSIFNHEDFQNLWLTFPKPTGELEPNRILINEQNSSDIPYTAFVWQGMALMSYQAYNTDIFRENFSEPDAFLNNTNQWTTITSPASSFPTISFITIVQTGVYSIRLTGISGNFRLIQSNALNELINTFDFTEEIIFNATAGDTLRCRIVPPSGSVYGDDPASIATFPNTAIGSPNLNSLQIEFNRIDGYAVNFEEIFIDFKVTDFLIEILVRFGLTPFKDKYSKKVKFLTLFELLQNQDVNDYSQKFVSKLSEKYTFGNYAKRNLFKYKYNDEGFKHNDGFIQINNDNLKDETVLVQSQIYSPESKKTSNFISESNVYKIWEKEIKDDSNVEYKDLEGRFYFQRAMKVNSEALLISELTSLTAESNFYFRESYFRLGYTQVLKDWYKPTGAIFNKAKLLIAEFYLKPFEVANFDFSRLIYVEQLSSYYIVNKVINFVKNRPTRLELIEVDYLSEINEVVNPVFEIIPGTPTVADCELIIPVTTNVPQPIAATLNIFTYVFDAFSGFSWQPFYLDFPITGTLNGNVAVFPLDTLPASGFGGYQFQISVLTGTFNLVLSPNTAAIDIDGSCFVPPNLPTVVTINSINNLGQTTVFPWTFNQLQINYTTDGVPPNYVIKIFAYSLISLNWEEIGQVSKLNTDPNNVTINALTLFSRIRISINNVTSNEIIL